MVCCSATWCKNSSTKGFSMLRFPKDPETRQKWANICGRDESWTPTKNSRLCHEHFAKEQWKTFREQLKDSQQAPTKVCACTGNQLIETGGGDHTYCKREKHDDDCYKVKVNAPKVLVDVSNVVENCDLKQMLVKVSSQVKLYENTIAAFGLMEKATEDSKSPGFTPKQIKDGLKLWFAAGTSGYTAFVNVLGKENNVRYPRVRTLQKQTEHIKFNPGVQPEIMSALKKKLEFVKDPNDRDCCLFFDAMAIKQALDFDIGTGSYLGQVTVPGVVEPGELASKGEVWMFGGIRTKWKQLVCWHLVSSREHPKEKALVIRDLLKRGHDCGLNVVGIVCDMGNRGVLSQLGFNFKRKTMIYCIKNPMVPTAKLWVVPDVIHVFKSMKEMLCTNEVLILDAELCKEFNLPSRAVKLEHIEWLEMYQRGEDLKFVPKLKLIDLKTPHFSKMKVRSAYQVFKSDVAAALFWLSQKGLVPKVFETTAWFVKLMDRWRELMTARTLVNALGKRNMKVFKEAVTILKVVIRVFKGMRVRGNKWKPVQTHLIMATEAMLEICTYLLVEKGYDFVLWGRFLQDIVENLFSVVRMQRPMPGPVQFKYRLKQCAISQFNQEIKNSSYDYAGTDDFIDLLKDEFESEGDKVEEVIDISKYVWHESVPAGSFAPGQEDILYKMSGYPIKSLIKKKILTCQLCISKLKHEGDKPHPNAALLKEAERKEGVLISVTDELFQAFRLVEYNLRKWKVTLSESSDCFFPLLRDRILPSTAYVNLKTCHDVWKSLATIFFWMRLKQLSVTLTSTIVDQSKVTSQFSSKTAGEKLLASKFTVTPAKRKKKMEPNSMKRLKELP